MHTVVVANDITTDSRRAEVARVLEGYGQRVQYSVFECRLDGRSHAELSNELRALIDESDDSIRYYPLCARCQTRADIQGRGIIVDDPSIVII